MLAALSRATFSALASSGTAKALASRYGLRRPDSPARRFVAGTSLDEGLEAARALEQSGLTVTLDRLGEHTTEREAASSATRSIITLIRAAAAAGVSRNVSIKLTQIGLDIDESTATDNVRRILDVAAEHDGFVRIDMEGSDHTDVTLDMFEGLWRIGHRNVGVVIQAYLRRSEADAKRVIALGGRVRLVKGAYDEPKETAFQSDAEVEAEFLKLMRMLLADGHYPAIATHDPALIDAAKAFAASRQLPAGSFEFQLLYGIRHDLQLSLAKEGFPVRVYVPFGEEWFPYLMRRLAERPENVAFVLRHLVRGSGA